MEKARATVYIDAPIYKAIRIKAAATGTNVSAIVNAALRQSLSEDRDDLTALADRVAEPTRPFEDFLKELTDDGLL
ncbi:MAG: CopG family transcriptional regulator [Proteobacteria bacterium]|jgi:hypothetical protein|nr:CopG family transcriptional regulator [Pseudomonadota bacterium]